eukprot:SAG31_NODE_9594_length_1253_cov_2.246967_2_plen_74_part_01
MVSDLHSAIGRVLRAAAGDSCPACGPNLPECLSLGFAAGAAAVGPDDTPRCTRGKVRHRTKNRSEGGGGGGGGR